MPGLRTVTLKVNCPQAQCVVLYLYCTSAVPTVSTVSLRLLDLSTVADCVEYSVSHNIFVLFNLTHKLFSNLSQSSKLRSLGDRPKTPQAKQQYCNTITVLQYYSSTVSSKLLQYSSRLLNSTTKY